MALVCGSVCDVQPDLTRPEVSTRLDWPGDACPQGGARLRPREPAAGSRHTRGSCSASRPRPRPRRKHPRRGCDPAGPVAIPSGKRPMWPHCHPTSTATEAVSGRVLGPAPCPQLCFQCAPWFLPREVQTLPRGHSGLAVSTMAAIGSSPGSVHCTWHRPPSSATSPVTREGSAVT